MPAIDNNCIEKISKTLGELLTGSEITSMFHQLELKDFDATRQQQLNFPTFHSTKWRRINESVTEACRTTNSAKPLFKAIEYTMRPANFLHDAESWTINKQSVNEDLIFYGFQINDSGKIESTQAATTFNEAQQRLQTLTDKLAQLNIHPSVLRYCRTELLQKNYFHALLEASKGIMDRVRAISELSDDGNTLINECFSQKNPIILIRSNMLITQTDKSKYQGLKSLLNTIVYLYRNPNAHEPKLYDVTSETDAVTAFTLMSLANSLLDDCINVRDLDLN